MSKPVRHVQIKLCEKVGAKPYACPPELKVGISRSALDGELPLNGLRHLDVKDTTGWYIWGGTELSQAENFFLPMHVSHLKERCALALKFLLLPPGWRFLTDGSYEDTWFDPSLLVA